MYAFREFLLQYECMNKQFYSKISTVHLFYVAYIFLFIHKITENISLPIKIQTCPIAVAKEIQVTFARAVICRSRSLGQCGWPPIFGGTVAPFGQFRSVHHLPFYSLDKLRVWCRQAWWRKALKINFTSCARKLPPFLSSVGCSLQPIQLVWYNTERNN